MNRKLLFSTLFALTLNFITHTMDQPQSCHICNETLPEHPVSNEVTFSRQVFNCNHAISFHTRCLADLLRSNENAQCPVCNQGLRARISIHSVPYEIALALSAINHPVTSVSVFGGTPPTLGPATMLSFTRRRHAIEQAYGPLRWPSGHSSNATKHNDDEQR